ncbi:Glutathione S-transferase C-terminal domain-containing protein [Orchesella cincta]|uniref:Protein JTB n=1 Tax=Orchesella cincta TaxID=48709 RepID=A0A1D2NKU6_ORCCI|nr:Glutathione S-transferase C-terminal domain-containing protein [Orchesella cincta]
MIELTLLILVLEEALTSGPINHSPTPFSVNQSNKGVEVKRDSEVPQIVTEKISNQQCWISEEFEVLQECTACTGFEINSQSLAACVETGLKEKLNCKKSGIAFRSCVSIKGVEERNFLLFMFSMLLVFVLSVGAVKVTTVVLRKMASTQVMKSQKSVSGRMAKETYELENRRYYDSIKKLPHLYVEVRKLAEPYVYLDLRNLIVLLIYEAFHLERWVELWIVSKAHAGTGDTTTTTTLDDVVNHRKFLRLKSSVVFNESTKSYNINSDKVNDIIRDSFEGIEVSTRKHPSITIADKRMVICGVSSVLRFMLKFAGTRIESRKDNVEDIDLLRKFKQYLGFRGGCLQACAESSIWTKFCEVDMLNVINGIDQSCQTLKCKLDLNDTELVSVPIPETIIQFENHLSLPVKVHNFRKVIQNSKKADTGSLSLESCKDQNKIELITDLKHEFAEGTIMLLSDLILFPSVDICVSCVGREVFRGIAPKTLEWYDKVNFVFQSLLSFDIDCYYSSILHTNQTKFEWVVPEVPMQSLYSRDPNRYKPTLRQFTRQYEIDEVLEFVKHQCIEPLEINEEEPCFEWTDIPLLAHPEGGNLPKTRQQRKCHQLASLVYYALQVYGETRMDCKSRRFRIVDFCSGGGHLGILVAYLLPECDVILVENKDESLRRAQERIEGLGLSNMYCYQSNLDYFDGDFDLGLALHACGTATDLAIEKCVAASASFVCCPCCYGAVQENHMLKYPRSSIFLKSQIPLRYYFILSHASDHTHDAAHEKTEQGKQCMTLIDTDRCLYAKENYYNVKLCKIVPDTASPKNHILVGVKKQNEKL